MDEAAVLSSNTSGASGLCTVMYMFNEQMVSGLKGNLDLLSVGAKQMLTIQFKSRGQTEMFDESENYATAFTVNKSQPS